jgi:molybdate transport repressor ModE-like protein
MEARHAMPPSGTRDERGSEERETSEFAASDRDRPLGFDPRHLAALVAIAKTGSFRLAGEQLGYVQSAVSRQLATLEQVAGARLVERARGGSEVRLTQAGELLANHAEALLARQAAARADLVQLAAGEIGAVRIGVPQGVGHRLLRPALSSYRRRRPQARVVASEYPSDAPLFELVERGTLDLGVARLPLELGPFDRTELLRVRWVLAVPSSWGLARAGGDVELAHLADKPLIGRHDDALGPPLEAELRALGVEPNVVFRTDIDATIRALVAAGMGAALLPSYAVGEGEAIAALALADLRLTEVIGLFWHRERVLAAAASELRDVMCEVCGRLGGDPRAAEVPAA